MRTFTIPFVIEQEEKIFGGYVSLRQAMHFLIGALSGVIFYTKLHLAIKVTFFLTVVTIALLFAFLKVGDVYLDRYTLIAIKYLLRKKIYLHGEADK